MADDRFIILRGSAHRLPLAENSVHCCVTSPPYWGLRAYGTGAQVFGGSEECAHEWGETEIRGGPAGAQGSTSQRQGRANVEEQIQRGRPQGAFCTHCQAWQGELGSEPSLDLFIEHMVAVFREVRRVLHPSGTLWLNMGDSYACKPNGRSAAATKAAGDDRTFRDKPFGTAGGGLKEKDLCMIPHRLAIALQEDGWWVRSDCIWAKPNPLPSGVTDRPGVAHEYLFLLTKGRRYYYDAEAVREPAIEGPRQWRNGNVQAAYRGNLEKDPQRGTAVTAGRGDPSAGRNLRTVWTITPEPSSYAHFATFPTKLAARAVLAGTSERGVCPKCAQPWRRVVERTGVDNKSNEVIPDYDVPGLAKGTSADRVRRLSGATYQYVVHATNRWTPTCRCEAGDPVSATVLDPFSGTGTTGVAALQLGRRYIGVELSAPYAQYSRERLAAVNPPLPLTEEPAEAARWEQLALVDEEAAACS